MSWELGRKGAIEEKTDGAGKDVCLAGDVNKIEAVL